MDEFEKRLQKLFDEASSGKTTPDPYCDNDGEFGSDKDYDPGRSCLSDSSDTSSELAEIRPRRVQVQVHSIPQDSSDTDSGSESILTAPPCEALRSTANDSVQQACVNLTDNHLPNNLLNEPMAEDRIEIATGSDRANDQNITEPCPLIRSTTLFHGQEEPRTGSDPITPAFVALADDLRFGDIYSEPIPEDWSQIVLGSSIEQDNDQDNNVPCSPNRSTTPDCNNCDTPPPTSYEWEATTSDIPHFSFDHASSGIQFVTEENTTEIEIFNKLFPIDTVNHIVRCTNAYGHALCNSSRPVTRNSRRFSYKDTNPDEMKAFLGLCLLQGQMSACQKRKLFTYTDVLYYHPIFTYCMSGRRFEQLLRCVYVSELDAKGHEKISLFIDAMMKIFQGCYKPSQELSLDESLLLFRGRLSFRQYIKSKKARYGIKFYELTSYDGYVLNMKMFVGKTDDEAGTKTEKLVLHLMNPYLMRGHHLFMDNYYNSVQLSEKLLNFRTHTCGTLRPNRRDNPKEMLTKKLKKHEHVWVRKNKIYVSKWVDKRPVHMLTTLHHPKLIDVSNRRGQWSKKPKEVAEYNQFMSGIDRADQMVSYYSSPRKTIRWYKKVFFHMLDLTVWNSYFLHQKYCKNKDFLSFRENLIRDLIKVSPNIKPENLIKFNKNSNRKQANVRVPQMEEPSTSRDGFGHWPEKIPETATNPTKKYYKKCKLCTTKKIRRETSLRCKGCDDKPPLCALCFEEWHILRQ